MSDNDAENHVTETQTDAQALLSMAGAWAEENELTKRRLDQQDKQLIRRGRLGMLAALVAIVALGAIGYFWRADVDARHAGEKRAAVVQHEVDQTLGIAHTFLCQQTPTPKGCPPQPPNAAQSQTQAVIAQVVQQTVTAIERVYPPPNGLR